MIYGQEQIVWKWMWLPKRLWSLRHKRYIRVWLEWAPIRQGFTSALGLWDFWEDLSWGDVVSKTDVIDDIARECTASVYPKGKISDQDREATIRDMSKIIRRRVSA